MATSLEALEVALAGDFSPESLVHCLQRPKELAEVVDATVSATYDVARPEDLDLPLISPGELRPILRPSIPGGTLDGITWAEHTLNRINSTLLYAHSAVVVDPWNPLYYGDDRYTRAKLLEILHLFTVIRPLIDAGIVFVIPRFDAPRKWVRGPWPRRRYPPTGRARLLRWIEDHQEFTLLKGEDAYSRDVEQGRWQKRQILDGMQQSNALAGRAHFLLDTAIGALDWDYWEAKDRTVFESLLGRAALAYAVRHRVARSLAPSYEMFVEAKRLASLFRQPVPDLTLITTGDLIRLREAEAFDSWRHELSSVLDAFEAGPRDTVAERAVAEALSARADELDAAVGQSTRMSALRKGTGTFALGLVAGVTATPLIGIENLKIQAALSAGLGLAEFTRGIIAAERQEESNFAVVQARASAARAAAEHFR